MLLTRDVNVVTFNGCRNVTTVIPRPKNAWWCASVEARCFDSGEAGDFSPVRWLEYYRHHSVVVLEDNEAAFQTATGAALTRDFMVNRSSELFVLAGIFLIAEDGSRSPIKASSWRAGGAMSATKAGLAGPLIMALGRWRSIAWGAYVAYSVKDLESAAQQMWSVSCAAPPETSLVVGVPRFEDDPLDVDRLRNIIAHRRAGPNALQGSVSVSRQCG